MIIFVKLYQISRMMRNSKTGKKIFDLLDALGIRIVFGRFINWKTAHDNERHPTDQMLRSRDYFKENRRAVKKTLRLLEDEESRNVLKRMIYFRCYSRYRSLPHNSMRTQYFINEFFSYDSREVYVDCGAYDGDSVDAFIKRVRRRTKRVENIRIIAFEPDRNNYKNLVRNHPEAVAFRAGVWSEDGFLAFGCDGSGSAFVDGDRSISDIQGDIVKVPVRSIDNTSVCKDATFIKMDIEGSEYHALLGAQNVIRTNKPKLAICIYHSDEDMLRLIRLVHDLVPEYRLYVRQHSNSIGETVLYATI